MTSFSDPTLLSLAAVPLVIGATAALLGRRTARKLSPAVATVLLTALALTVALVTGLLLSLAGVIALAQLPPLSGLDHWSPAAVRLHVPIPLAAGLLSGLVATVLLSAASLHLLNVVSQMRRTSAETAALPAIGDLVVVEDEAAFAYAVPGRRQRIVTSKGMLRSLTAPQRRVLLAHEAAHLRYRHHLYVQAGRVSAAANPLMRPISRAIDLAVERWADEAAAREIGDRTVAAGALSAAALARPFVLAPALALPGAQSDILERVGGLLRPPVRHRMLATVATTAVVACWLACALEIRDVHALLELAEPITRR